MMWSTSVLGAVQPGHWQEGWAWRVRVRREAQGARWEGWAWSHRVCAEGVRLAWEGHLDVPEGVKRVHPGWVHLVGGMVGVMAPAYAPRPERATVTWVMRPPAHEPGHGSAWGVFVSGSPRVLLLYTLYYNPFITLSLYISFLLV